MLDCFRCKKPMHSQGGSNNERRHLCSTHIQLKTACDQISVSADRLEAQLIAQWPQFRLPEDWQEDIIGYLLDDEGLHVILAQRRELQQHFDRVEQLYEDEEIDRKVYLKELRTFERRMAKLSLETRTDVDLKQARALLSDFSSLWSLMTALEQQEITQTLLKRAVVENQRIVVWHWYTPFADLFRSDAK